MDNYLLPQRLASLRKKKGISQYELAEALGYTRGQIANYEQGTRRPDPGTIVRLAEYFDCPVDYLLGRGVFKNWDAIMAHKDVIVETLEHYPFFQEIKLRDCDEKQLMHLFSLLFAKITIETVDNNMEPGIDVKITFYPTFPLDKLKLPPSEPKTTEVANRAIADDPELAEFARLPKEEQRKLLRIQRALEDEEAATAG